MKRAFAEFFGTVERSKVAADWKVRAPFLTPPWTQGHGQSRRTAALRAAARAITLRHPAWNGRASQFPHAAARRAAVRWREFVNGPARREKNGRVPRTRVKSPTRPNRANTPYRANLPTEETFNR